MALDKSFLGTGWGFPPQFSPHNKSIILVTEDQDIQQSLRILFSTSPGETPARTQKGFIQCPLALF